MINSASQKGWSNAGLQAGQTRGQLRDEEYDKTLAIHDPVWRYIIVHYPREIYGTNIFPVVVCGYNAVPVAIELSQWGYPITFLAENEEALKRAKRDLEIHAGTIKQGFSFDFRRNVPPGAILCFLNVLEAVKTNVELFTTIDLMLRRTREIVCAVHNDRDWKTLLESKYDITYKPYPDSKYILLAIREQSSVQRGVPMAV